MASVWLETRHLQAQHYSAATFIAVTNNPFPCLQDVPSMPTVYKIISQSDWETACREEKFTGAEIDVADGYIHLSTAKQVRETASKHFAGRDDLLLLSVCSERFGDSMKWEPSRGGDLFPHLYGVLPVKGVEKADSLKLDDLGNHVFPDDVPE